MLIYDGVTIWLEVKSVDSRAGTDYWAWALFTVGGKTHKKAENGRDKPKLGKLTRNMELETKNQEKGKKNLETQRNQQQEKHRWNTGWQADESTTNKGRHVA